MGSDITQADCYTFHPSISAMVVIAISSDGANPVPGDANAVIEAFVHERGSGTGAISCW